MVDNDYNLASDLDGAKLSLIKETGVVTWCDKFICYNQKRLSTHSPHVEPELTTGAVKGSSIFATDMTKYVFKV